MKNLVKDLVLRALYDVPGEVIKYNKGQYLFHEGDRADFFYLLRYGRIKIVKYAASGRALALRLAQGGSIVGELPLFEEHPTYVFNAQAMIPSEVYAIPYAVLEKYVTQEPVLATAIMRLTTEHMRKQHSKYRDLIMYGKKGAFYSTLIRFANSYGIEQEDGILIAVPLTNQELAEYAATSREIVNRMLRILREARVVEYKNKMLLIRDIQYLRKEINCEYCDRSICTID